ncbi:hypothetical protein ABK040_000701 [Willaertia magna]
MLNNTDELTQFNQTLNALQTIENLENMMKTEFLEDNASDQSLFSFQDSYQLTSTPQHSPVQPTPTNNTTTTTNTNLSTNNSQPQQQLGHATTGNANNNSASGHMNLNNVGINNLNHAAIQNYIQQHSYLPMTSATTGSLHHPNSAFQQSKQFLQSYLNNAAASLNSQQQTTNSNSGKLGIPRSSSYPQLSTLVQQQQQQTKQQQQQQHFNFINNLSASLAVQQANQHGNPNSTQVVANPNFSRHLTTKGMGTSLVDKNNQFLTTSNNTNLPIQTSHQQTVVASSSNNSNNSNSNNNNTNNNTNSSNNNTTAAATLFSTLDKGIHAVQQVIVNGGIANLQVWSNCLMHLIPVLKVIDDNIPETIIGGKSVSNRKKTPLNVSMEVSLDRFRMLVGTIISMIRQHNAIVDKEGEAFVQVSEKQNLIINLEDLKLRVARNEIGFSDDLWKADVSLLMNNQEQDKGLTRDKPKKKKNEKVREGFSVLSNPENPATTIIQFAPIKAGVVSNNKRNCQLRYKLCYDSWLVYYVDSTKTFAINCGKNTKAKRKSSSSQSLANGSSSGSLSSKMMLNGDVMNIDDLKNEDHDSNSSLGDNDIPSDPEMKSLSLKRSASTLSLVSCASTSSEKPPTVAIANNGSFIVSPKSGSVKGGYFVFIQFTFDSKLISDPEQLKVFFGTQEAEIQQMNDNSIFVIAPKSEEKGDVLIEIRTSNFTVSNPNDLKFEYIEDSNNNNNNGGSESSPLEFSKKRKHVGDNAPQLEVSDNNSKVPTPPTISTSNTTVATTSGVNGVVRAPEKKKRKEVPTSPYRREWAIVIAIDKYYSNKLLHESSASSVNDAMNIANILSKIYGYEVRVLLNEEATFSKVNQLFVSLAESSSIQSDDAILIYFTGVSISKTFVNGYVENYLALYDTDPDNVVNTAISHQSFVNFHHRLSAKHILFIFDTFYNGIVLKAVNDYHSNKDIKYYASNKAVQMICASQQSTNMKPGVFSKELVNLLTTMKWGNEGLKGGMSLLPFYTTIDLGKQLQQRLYKATVVQVPRYGDIELGGGSFLFIPKNVEKHSYNTEIERIVSLLSLYEDYIHNMNLGDLHKHENLMQLLKMKFFQISNFYLQTIEKLINEERIDLRSDIYSSHKLNLTEILKTVRYSYLALYRYVDEWVLHNSYHLADVNKKLLESNPNAVVKRIFVVAIPGMTKEQEKEYFKLMKYHKDAGIEVRVIFHKDLDDRKEIPNNFSIIDSRLGHYLSFEDDYPKSVLIFNRKGVADLYYSKFRYVYSRSIPFDTYVKEHCAVLQQEEEEEQKQLNNNDHATNNCSNGCKGSKDKIDNDCSHCNNGMCNVDHNSIENEPITNDALHEQEKNMSLTDPLLSFDLQENIETLQICLDPLLQGFKKKFLEMLNAPKDKHARHCGKCLLLQKFHQISMHYENQITTFFSKGEIVVHANFYDNMRLRLLDIQNYVENICQDIIPFHSWITKSKITPYFTFESVDEIAEMNKRVKERNPNIKIERIFVFYKGIIESVYIEEGTLSKSSIIKTLKFHKDCGVDVYITILDTIEDVKTKVPGNCCIVDGKVCGSTTLHIEPSKCQGMHAYYNNAIEGKEEDVKKKRELWNSLREKAIGLDEFLSTVLHYEEE